MYKYFFLFLLIPVFCQGELILEEKVGQLLMTHFNGEIANEEARCLIQDAHVGGIIYYNWANTLHSPEQVLKLSDSLQQIALSKTNPIPLFIGVDQEGGVVNRLTEGFTLFPSNRVLARTKKPALAEACALAMSEELSAVGVNVNFAPVCDISNMEDSILGMRSFGDKTDVIVFAKAMLLGFKKGNMIATLKHFPGLGNAQTDPHHALPIVNRSLDELQHLELLPYNLLKNQADAVMTAHVLLPEIDPINCATLSKTVMDVLRNDIGFDGVVFSDSLVMKGVLDNGGTVEETALKAFLAGCDVLLLGGKQLLEHQTGFELTTENILKIHRYLVNNVHSGEITQERLDRSVDRILKLKRSYGLFQRSTNEQPLSLIRSEKHLDLAREIAETGQ